MARAKNNIEIFLQHKNISTRQIKNFDQAEFVSDLLGVDWRGILQNTNDVNVVVSKWTNMFSLILEKHAPVRNRRVSDKLCPWLTSDFKLMCKARDKLKNKLFAQTPDYYCSPIDIFVTKLINQMGN